MGGGCGGECRSECVIHATGHPTYNPKARFCLHLFLPRANQCYHQEIHQKLCCAFITRGSTQPTILRRVNFSTDLISLFFYECLHLCNGPDISEPFHPHCFTFHRHCFPRVLASQKIIDDSEDPTPHRDSRYHPNSSTDLHQAPTPSHKKNIHQKKAPGPHERGTH